MASQLRPAPVAVDRDGAEPQLDDGAARLRRARLDALRSERDDARSDELAGAAPLRLRRRVVVAHAEREAQPRIPVALVRRPERVAVDAVRDEDLHIEPRLRQQPRALIDGAVSDRPRALPGRRGGGVDRAGALPRGGCAEPAPARLAVGEERRVAQQHIQRLVGDAYGFPNAGEVRRRKEVAVAVYLAERRRLRRGLGHRAPSSLIRMLRNARYVTPSARSASRGAPSLNSGSIWHHLAPFTPALRRRMRPIRGRFGAK